MNKPVNNALSSLISAGLVVATAHSTAEHNGGQFYLVPSLGYHATSKIDDIKKYEDNTSSLDFDDAPAYGIAFGWQFNGHYAVELAYNYTKFDFIGTDYELNASFKSKVGHHFAHIDGVYYFQDIYENDFSIYLPVGLGYGKYEPKNGGESFDDTVFNLGIGAQRMFGEHFGLRADLRGIYGLGQKNFDGLAQVGLVFRLGVPVPVDVAGAPPQSANLRFKFDSTELTNPKDPQIAVLASSLKNNPDSNIKILTYSDKSGNTDYNMKLSERRAESLKNMLITRYGIEEDRIYTKAFGDQAGLSRARHAIAVVEY
ncbi:MAG: OmpA family protein [Cellvibrionales bacterium]|nr:OmpA family protein [Cellvibrionales bacterium]